MTRRRRCATGVVIAAACALAPAFRAEVSADTSASINVLILGVIEGPDPIGQGAQALWRPVRDVDPTLFLNPDGATRDDGRPSIAFDPENGWPRVTWAYDAPGGYDVVYARWTGAGWSTPELVTPKAADDLDPRIHVGTEGTIWVAWWEAPAERVWLTSQRPGTAWEEPELVTSLAEAGRRPSIAVWQRIALVAYERASVVDNQEVVVATRTAPGVFTTTVVATTSRKDALDPVLHVESGKVWVDWRHDSDAYAWAILEGSVWGALQVIEWNDHSWAGEEQAREYIKHYALAD